MNSRTSLSVQDVAEMLDISKNTVYELIKRNELPSYRIGRKVRIDLQDIEDYLNKTRTDVKQELRPTLIGSYQIPPSRDENSMVRIFQQSSLISNDNFIVCGQDLLLDILTSYMARPPYNLHALRSYTGSYNGLIELYRGNVHVSSAHLWDGETGTYNIPFLRTLLPGLHCVAMNLTYRMQGFYVEKGNPKNIKSWEDLLRSDVTMINRELGCGVRILIDESLRKLNLSRFNIKGYNNFDFSHLAVASAVSRGDVDVSIGNEKTALQVSNIDFIPIQKERLDLIFIKDYMYDPHCRAIAEIVNSKAFQNEMIGIGGYDTCDTGKIIAEI